MSRVSALMPRLQMLSNGRYHVLITREGSGYSRWNGSAICRWREDATRDCLGQFFYLRDASGGGPWSATVEPTGQQEDTVESTFVPGLASFLRRHVGSHLTIPMHDVDRAIADSEEDGFVKVHVREGSDKILGATIVARHAGEMINSISLAMVAGSGLRELANVVQAYPTQGAGIRQAADACARTRVTPLMMTLARRWLRR